MIAGGVALLGLILFYFVSSQSFESAPQLAPKPIVLTRAQLRDQEFQKAQNQILLAPGEAVVVMKKLALENPEDNIGKQATQSVVQYYKLHGPVEAGKFLVSIKQPVAALPFFLNENPDYDNAVTALNMILATEKNLEVRKKYLVQYIDMLLGPLHRDQDALAYIREYSRDYPSESNPYGFFLKSNAEKTQELFSRVSFVYTKSLLAYLESEFAQINFAHHPSVELVKEKGDRYRIVATYRGDVRLNHDQLSDIHFIFWLVEEHWELIDTNLTAERAAWTKGRRRQLINHTTGQAEMLRILENEFRAQFPNLSLHQSAAPPKE